MIIRGMCLLLLRWFLGRKKVEGTGWEVYKIVM